MSRLPYTGESAAESNSYNVRNVNTDGSLNNNNAFNGNNGVRLECGGISTAY